jgi:alkanesulfonate monooxygenase SsuD/methylene tetrahydromethanopterin reductase-like flavin-dependent oxidoreductase (luciferase family)
MVGGGGEQKTLRLVAQYADGTNVFGGPDTLRRKYAILREHCESVGRPFAEIERSTLQSTRLSAAGAAGMETPEAAAERFAALADAGAQHVVVSIQNVEQPGVADLAARLAELVHGIATAP